MKQQTFEARNAATWDRLQRILDGLEAGGAAAPAPEDSDALPPLYRDVCQHLALAKGRHYSPRLVNRLHDLVMRTHQQLYRARLPVLPRVVGFFLRDFPRAVRREAGLFWLSTALFVLPGLLVGWLCFHSPDLIYSVMSGDEVMEMEEMYDPQLREDEGRGSESDFLMFGYYIFNNVGIGFRTFASGLLFGVGTVLVLVFNGLAMGSVAGYLTQLGFTSTFWPFVAGHGSFELTAIVICGAAGLQLARALVAPGRLGRLGALRKAGGDSVPLVIGAASMLLVAAFIEAFWSSANAVPNGVKYTVAAALWLLVMLYLGFAGRSRGT